MEASGVAEMEEDHKKAWECLCAQFDNQRAILMYRYGMYLRIGVQQDCCFVRKHSNFSI